MRILIASLNADLCTALDQYLKHKTGLQVVAVVDDTQELRAQSQDTEPDVILLDYHFSSEPLTVEIQKLKQLDFAPGVILINVPLGEQAKAKEYGCDEMVMSGDTGKALLLAIEAVRLRGG